jgi:hypothetical protein
MGETDVHVGRSNHLTFAVITMLIAPKNAESTGKRREGQCMLVVGHGKYPWPKDALGIIRGRHRCAKPTGMLPKAPSIGTCLWPEVQVKRACVESDNRSRSKLGYSDQFIIYIQLAQNSPLTSTFFQQ